MWSYFKGGFALFAEGFTVSVYTLFEILPLLILAFIVAGLIEALVPREVVERLLSGKAGLKGIVLGSLAGSLMPAGPYVFYPLVASFLRSGAGIGTMIAFVAAKRLWSFSRLPLEIALLGPYLVFVRFVVTLPIPIIMGFAANSFFSESEDFIRQRVIEE